MVMVIGLYWWLSYLYIKWVVVREHHKVVFPTNHISAFRMGLCVSGGFYVKYIYMIGLEHSHVVLPDHASLSRVVYELYFCYINSWICIVFIFLMHLLCVNRFMFTSTCLTEISSKCLRVGVNNYRDVLASSSASNIWRFCYMQWYITFDDSVTCSNSYIYGFLSFLYVQIAPTLVDLYNLSRYQLNLILVL